MSTPSFAPSCGEVRARFPALSGEWALLENAGGSQVPAGVSDAIREYMRTTYVQLGAGYEISRRADAVVAAAHDLANLVMGGADTGVAIIGPSSSQLVAMLAQGLAPRFEPGDNIVIAEAGHEANMGPWARLAKQGVEIRWWPPTADGGTGSLEALDGLLDERTRVVAAVHVSNLLGEVVDVAEVARHAHAVGARVVVDGVAYAPHRAIDVAAWGIDWYVFSTYKVYGPHMAVLWGTHDAIAEVERPSHFFVPDDDIPYAFELGGVSHEGCAAWNAVGDHLRFLAGRTDSSPVDRETVVAGFDTMAALEAPLVARLLTGLSEIPGVTLVGAAEVAARVPTVSFTVCGHTSEAVAAAAHAERIAIRHGHMYAHRLCTRLGLPIDDGVVRVSAVHYNTVAEIDRLLEVVTQIASEPSPHRSRGLHA